MRGVGEAQSRRARLGTALLFIISCAIALGLAEGGLRIAGFESALVPKVQFGWPDPAALKLYDSDPDLFWVPKQYRALYFRKDGIHLTLGGDRPLASMLAAGIVSPLGPER